MRTKELKATARAKNIKKHKCNVKDMHTCIHPVFICIHFLFILQKNILEDKEINQTNGIQL